MGLLDIFGFNKFAKQFADSRPEDVKKREAEEIHNSQGISREEMDLAPMDSSNAQYMGYSGQSTIGIQFEQYFGGKKARIAKYREMSLYPEINDAIDAVCNDAIVEDNNGNIVNLDIDEEIPEHVEEEIRKIWDYLVRDVFSFNERGWDLFRKWLVEAELYVENVMNDDANDIIGIKVLPAFTMVPIYKENKIQGYIQVTNQKDIDKMYNTGQSTGALASNYIVFDRDQVNYSNYGLYGANMMDVRGYLESAVRTYNQLKNLEDAVVVYRLVRAPERRVWNIYTGRMPKGKAEEYIKGMIQRYKKRITYDSQTGAMDSAQNVQALTEDFWFSKNDKGEGTTVDTIGGGMNLGEIEDVNYFLRKLYKTLKLPNSRWSDPAANTYSSGKAGEITREEIKFSRFIDRLLNRFKYILVDPFITLLRLRGIDERYVDEKIYNVQFTKSNLFKEYKEMELLDSKFSLLSSIEPYVYKPEENENGFFSQEFVMKNYFMMSDEEYEENQNRLEEEKVKAEQARAELEAQGLIGGEEGEGAFGGGGLGGGDFGGGVGDFGGGAPGGEGGLEGGLEGGAEAPEPASPEAVGAELAGLEAGFEVDSSGKFILSEWNKEDKKLIEKNKRKKNNGDPERGIIL